MIHPAVSPTNSSQNVYAHKLKRYGENRGNYGNHELKTMMSSLKSISLLILALLQGSVLAFSPVLRPISRELRSSCWIGEVRPFVRLSESVSSDAAFVPEAGADVEEEEEEEENDLEKAEMLGRGSAKVCLSFFTYSRVRCGVDFPSTFLKSHRFRPLKHLIAYFIFPLSITSPSPNPGKAREEERKRC